MKFRLNVSAHAKLRQYLFRQTLIISLPSLYHYTLIFKGAIWERSFVKDRTACAVLCDVHVFLLLALKASGSKKEFNFVFPFWILGRGAGVNAQNPKLLVMNLG